MSLHEIEQLDACQCSGKHSFALLAPPAHASWCHRHAPHLGLEHTTSFSTITIGDNRVHKQDHGLPGMRTAGKVHEPMSTFLEARAHTARKSWRHSNSHLLVPLDGTYCCRRLPCSSSFAYICIPDSIIGNMSVTLASTPATLPAKVARSGDSSDLRKKPEKGKWP